MTHRLSAPIFEWIDEALTETLNADDVRWDGAVALAEEGLYVPVVFTLPGAVLGTEVRMTASLTDLRSADREAIKVFVTEAVERLHAERSQQLAGAGAGG